MYLERKLNATEVKYKIICGGSGFDIGCGKQIVVICNGKRYDAKTHKTTKGRIDGLSQLFSDLNLKEGQELKISYNVGTNMVEVERKLKNVNKSIVRNSVDLEPNDETFHHPKIVGGYYKKEINNIGSFGITDVIIYEVGKNEEVVKVKINDLSLEDTTLYAVKNDNIVIQCCTRFGKIYYIVCDLKRKVVDRYYEERKTMEMVSVMTKGWQSGNVYIQKFDIQKLN